MFLNIKTQKTFPLFLYKTIFYNTDLNNIFRFGV